MQTRVDSLMETLTNIVIGLAIASTTNFFIIPHIMGVPLSGHQNAMISGAFTVVSLTRQYILRRLFNGRSPWQALKGWFTRPRYVW